MYRVGQSGGAGVARRGAWGRLRLSRPARRARDPGSRLPLQRGRDLSQRGRGVLVADVEERPDPRIEVAAQQAPRQGLHECGAHADAAGGGVGGEVELLEAAVERERAEEHRQVGVAQSARGEVDPLPRAQRRQEDARAAGEADGMLAPRDGGAEEEGGLEAAGGVGWGGVRMGMG